MKLAPTLIACAAAAALFAGSAQATPVLWTLSGVAFDDGATANGSFTYDAGTNSYSAWSINITDGALSAFTYDTTSSQLNILNQDADGVMFVKNDFSRYLNLNFISELTDAGGTVDLDIRRVIGFDQGSYDCNNCSTLRIATAGAVTAGTIPDEPGTVPERNALGRCCRRSPARLSTSGR